MTPSNDSPILLWQPSRERAAGSLLAQFMQKTGQKYGKKFDDYAGFWRWSVDNRADFWSDAWDFLGLIGEKGGRVLDFPDEMEKSIFFPEAKLNYAENLLRGEGSGPAMIFWGEDKSRRSEISFDQLRAEVTALQAHLKKCGVAPGDRVAAYVANMPQTIALMLAVASLGAVWSSCSPDFGVQGVLDRFQQIAPKVFITIDGYFYKGQKIDSLQKAREIAAALPSVESTIVVPYIEQQPNGSGLKNAALYSDIVAKPSGKLEFTRVSFNHPLFILFSSGTTGVPKCIVHGHGGTLIQLMKEHQLQCDVRPGDRVFYYTTCGWMMWNWLGAALASRATLILFDGFPFQNKGKIIFDIIADERATLFGTAAKFIDAAAKLKLDPATTHDLSALRLVTSTGSPLSPEGFEYVYRNIKKDVCLSSISGGTDIVSCFVIGSPISPVYRGEIQVAGLGLDMAVFDESGHPVIGEKGELVCRKSFPCQPVQFWNDEGRKKYHAAYFARFPNIWCHGDYAEQTKRGGFVIYGRSDAVLNPGGVRIGTAEIYRQVEKLEEVQESLVIGQDWDNDVRVILFVKLAEGASLTEELKKKISVQIRDHASPRHVPAKIIAVADIPRTKSGKIVELAVREVVHGREVKNKEALANPEALEYFKNIADLAA